MNTHTITRTQLDKIAETMDTQFADALQDGPAGIRSIRDCFYKPDMYEEQDLYALKDGALEDYPDELRQKTHEMIASISSVD